MLLSGLGRWVGGHRWAGARVRGCGTARCLAPEWFAPVPGDFQQYVIPGTGYEVRGTTRRAQRSGAVERSGCAPSRAYLVLRTSYSVLRTAGNPRVRARA